MKYFGIASLSIVTLTRIFQLKNNSSHAIHDVEHLRENTLPHYHGDERRFHHDELNYKEVKNKM